MTELGYGGIMTKLKNIWKQKGGTGIDVRADHHSGILRNNSGRDSASDAALGFPKRPWLILLGCTFYGSVCGLRNRAGCTGYRHLLVRIWSGSDPAFDSDRRHGGYDCGSGHCLCFRTEDRSDAAKHHAGVHRHAPRWAALCG